MKRLILILLLLSSLHGFGAVGDLIGLEIETNGWICRVTIDSMGTNGQFFNGFSGTNNTLSPTNALIFTVVSMGFYDSGGGIMVTQTLYGTKLLRLPYPSSQYNAGQTNDIQSQGSAVVVRIALSGYIFTRDSNITATALSGYYATTNTSPWTNANAFTSQVVTNSTTAKYQRCIANWTLPSHNQIQSTNMLLEAVAFHALATSNRPVRCVRFVSQDQHGNAFTNFQTAMRLDTAFGDYLPSAQFMANMDISTFTNGDLMRCDFTAYPWIGDTNTAVFDTFNNEYAQPTPLPAAYSNICDRLSTYGASVAVVDVTNGTANGVVTTNFNSASPPATFANMGQALNAIVKTNNILYSRSNAAGGYIYLTNGLNYLWGASAQPVGNTASSWITICPFPGVSRSEVMISGKAAWNAMSDCEHLSNVTVRTTSATVFDVSHSSPNLWFDNCVMSNSSVSTISDITNLYYTRCDIQSSAQGIAPLHAGCDPVLVRGNLFRDIQKIGRPRTVVGNLKTTNQSDAGAWSADWTAAADKPPEYVIIYNNIWLGSSNAAGATFLGGWSSANLTNGAAIVQNVWEETKYNAGGSPMIGIASDGSTSDPVRNLLIWHNTCVAGRQNMGYNDLGSAPVERRFWSVKNNNFDRWSIKDDRFATPNGARIGNWPIIFGVQCGGNYHAWVGAVPTSFVQDFRGLNDVDNFQETIARYAYVSWAGYDVLNSINGIGGGTYRPKQGAHFATIVGDALLPFDIIGTPRTSGNNPPGAFVFYGGGPTMITGQARMSGKALLK